MVRQLLVPFVLFETAYRIFIWVIPIPGLLSYVPPWFDDRMPLVSPFWLMWYLLCLFNWRLLLPLFSRLPYPPLIGIAVGLVAGYVIPMDKYFCIQRTLIFLPFFLAGHEMRQQGMQRWIKTIPKFYYYPIYIKSIWTDIEKILQFFWVI